jgi:hypothetical protein
MSNIYLVIKNKKKLRRNKMFKKSIITGIGIIVRLMAEAGSAKHVTLVANCTGCYGFKQRNAGVNLYTKGENI